MKKISVYEVGDTVFVRAPDRTISREGKIVHIRLKNGTSTFSPELIEYFVKFEDEKKAISFPIEELYYEYYNRI